MEGTVWLEDFLQVHVLSGQKFRTTLQHRGRSVPDAELLLTAPSLGRICSNKEDILAQYVDYGTKDFFALPLLDSAVLQLSHGYVEWCNSLAHWIQ